jgi:hypothetical protein
MGIADKLRNDDLTVRRFKDAAQRIQSAQEVAEMLSHHMAPLPQSGVRSQNYRALNQASYGSTVTTNP